MSYRSGNLALVTPPEQNAPEIGNPADRRIHERISVSELGWLTAVRLKYGPQVSLLDLSVGGAQIETVSHRLQPGSSVVIEITGVNGEMAVPARVVRCQLTGLVPQTTYRCALQFKRPIELPARAEGDVNALLEHERLTAALKKTGAQPAGSPGVRLTLLGTKALLAAQQMIESPSALRAGEPFSRHMSRLLKAITRSVEQGSSQEDVFAEMTRTLRRSVPARDIRLIDPSDASQVDSADAVAFDVPLAATGAKLLVELPFGCHLEEWQVQLLKTAANLVPITKDAVGVAAPAGERAHSAESAEAGRWHRLVLRHTDGRMLKGFGRNFVPALNRIQVWAAPNCPEESRITVPLTNLKAVFFVHDLEGGANLPDPPESDPEPGRAIVITFNDGEEIPATTANYTPDPPGFFATPTEPGTNNQRIFVVSSAVRGVRFP